jgi:CDP-diacylglycerol--glycerol-3-phosphate 3-phosphatidyltransferase
MSVLNLPNIITLTRILAAPVIMLLMYLPQYPGPVMNWLLVLFFAAACLTDLVDGRLARGRGEVTAMGKFLDPLADKILIGTVLVMLVRVDLAPAWIVALILSRELAVTGVRAVAVEQGIVMAADRFGKWKTVLQCVACGCLLFNGLFLGVHWGDVGDVVLYLALILTLFSGGNYLYKFYRNLLEEENR